jgi:hypothetical protein
MELSEYFCAKSGGRTKAPYVPSWDLESLSSLCEKAIFWEKSGFQRQAGELVHFLLPYEPFLPLFCSDKEFREEELRALFALVKKIPPVQPALAPMGATFFKSFAFEAAFQLHFPGSFGVIKAGNVEIRAMGPQPLPLSDASKLGISGEGEDGWVSCLGLPEIWLRSSMDLCDEKCSLALDFVGVTQETPLAFAFYLKAPSCKVGSQILKPKALSRFQGEGNCLEFNHVAIESSFTHKLQVIPLAGFGGFWNSDFLVAFEVHPMQTQMRFSIVAK